MPSLPTYQSGWISAFNYTNWNWASSVYQLRLSGSYTDHADRVTVSFRAELRERVLAGGWNIIRVTAWAGGSRVYSGEATWSTDASYGYTSTWNYWEAPISNWKEGSFTVWKTAVSQTLDIYVDMFPSPSDHPGIRWVNGQNRNPSTPSQHLNGRVKIKIGVAPKPPTAPTGLKISPTTIDVASQVSTRPILSWSPPSGASKYQVLTRHIRNGSIHASNTVDVGNVSSRTINPWPGVEYLRYDTLNCWVRAGNSAGWSGWSPVNPASNTQSSVKTTYTEVLSLAPNNAHVIGRRGTQNQILFNGENGCTLKFKGQSNGSYPIDHFILYREDGWSVKIPKSSTRVSGGWTIATVNLPKVAKPNRNYWFEIRAYNIKGRPVHMSNGAWFRWNVWFYGGLIYIVDDASKWREGIAWIHTGSGFIEGIETYIHNGTTWKTL